MTQFAFHTYFSSQLVQSTNPLIDLYLIKRNIEQNLIQQITLNLELQERFNECNVEKSTKIEESDAYSLSEISAELTSSQFVNEEKRGRKKSKKSERSKNDTKNVPKNFGKAIITFIEQNQVIATKLLKESGLQYQAFIQILKEKKKSLNSIAELRNLWTDSNFCYAREMRTLSIYFLKKASLSYIFGSRISHHEGHIKYRRRLIEAIKNPNQFTFIKE